MVGKEWEKETQPLECSIGQDLYNDLVERSLVISLRDASAENAVVGKASDGFGSLVAMVSMGSFPFFWPFLGLVQGETKRRSTMLGGF